MIKFLDGKIDPRPVVEIYRQNLKKFAVVADHEGFVDVCIDDSFSWSPTDPIYGGALTEPCVVDADKDTLLRYKYYEGMLAIGDIIEITGGRKMKGEVKTIEGFYNYHINERLEIPYVKFTDGTSVQQRYIKLISPEERNNEYSKGSN